MVYVESFNSADGAPRSVELPRHVFVGRQPLLDAEEQLFGYELLYRASEKAQKAEITDPAAATATVVMNLLAEIGVERIAGHSKILLNCPASSLRSDLLDLLPSHQVILEVDVADFGDEDIRSVLARIAERGMQVAIHGQADGLLSIEQANDVATFAKVDSMALAPNDLRAAVAHLKGLGLRVIAEKVETRQDFEFAREIGCGLFQGYHFCKPQIVKGRRAPANQVTVMQLLNKINDDKTNRNELTRLITNEVSLSFRLLRTLNSAAFGLRRKVETVEHALNLMGDNKLRQWVSMLVVSGVEGKPLELSREALLRAIMCEKLAERTRSCPPAGAFTVGLFSVLDTMMDMKMRRVLRDLPLTQEVGNALLGRSSPYSETLQAVLDYERGSFEESKTLATRPDVLTAIWIEATTEMERAFSYMTAQAAE